VGRLGVAWERFWFEPEPAAGLGVVRALVYAGLLAIYSRTDLSSFGTLPAEFYAPVAPLRLLSLPVLAESHLRALHWLWLLSLALGSLGLFSRASAVAAFVVGAYLLGVEDSFGRKDHRDMVVVLTLGILAASHAGDAFSIDAWLRRRAGIGPPAPSPEYRWPAQAVRLTLAAAFFTAGVAKLRHSGLAWVASDNLRDLLIEVSYIGFHTGHQPNLLFARSAFLCKMLAGATLAIEVLYPLALVSARARVVLVPASLALLVGFALILGPRFTTWAVLSVVWLPLDRLGSVGRGRAG